VFVLGKPFQSNLMFKGRARSTPERCGRLQPYLESFSLDWKCFRLFGPFENYGRNIFKTLAPESSWSVESFESLIKLNALVKPINLFAHVVS
jgi:hypothetical protein